MTTLAETIRRAGGVFVTGTDTSCGKTVAAACLVRALDGAYWKPVQSGRDDVADRDIVRMLTGLDQAFLPSPAYELTQPLSPHEAARRDGVSITMDAFTLPDVGRPLVVEGAGGLMVPLNDTHMMIDLAEQLDLPVVLVARSGLGTINHTLLSLDAMRERTIPLLGVIMNGPPNPANRDAIQMYGHAPVLYQVLPMDPLDKLSVAHTAADLSAALEKESKETTK